MNNIMASSIRTTILSTFLLMSSCAAVFASVPVDIKGNKRVESEAILSHVNFQGSAAPTNTEMDSALKALYATGFFKDVRITYEGGHVVIRVEENPLITKVAFEGNNKLKDDKLTEEVQIRAGEVLSQSRVQSAQQRILEIYRQMGRFSATVEPKVIKQDQNRVILVFEINEGSTTYVRTINFVGNKHVSKSKLEEAMLTKRKRWFRFFATDDVYDPHRFIADQEAVRNVYMNQGYADVQLMSSIAELTPDHKDFHLTFTLNEGEQYTFGKTKIESKIKGLKGDALGQYLEYKEGDTFSKKIVDKSIEKMTDALGARGYAFADVRPVENKDRVKKIIHFTFQVEEGAKVYIERITVEGNDRTRINVIMRELTLHEGDAFNTVKLKKSEQRLKDLGYFKEVNIDVKQGSAPDKAILIVKVEEQQTGEINFGVGFSTIDKALANIRYLEKNLLGTGNILHADLTVAKKRQDFDIGIINPYFLGRNLEAGADVFVVRNHRLSAFTQLTKGVSTHIGYPITEYLGQTINYSLRHDRVEKVSRFASTIIKEQAGNTITSALGQTLAYDRRDSKTAPTSGYILSVSNTYAGLGGQITYFRHTVGASTFFPVFEECVLNLRAVGGFLQRTGKTIRVIDSFMLGADSFRGFEYGSPGPIDKSTGDPLGGTRYWVGTMEFVFPIGLPSEFGVKGALGSDFGTVWKPGKTNKNVVDDKKLRQSAFVGLSWDSPFGPLRVDYSFYTKKQKYDEGQKLLIGFSSRF